MAPEPGESRGEHLDVFCFPQCVSSGCLLSRGPFLPQVTNSFLASGRDPPRCVNTAAPRAQQAAGLVRRLIPWAWLAFVCAAAGFLLTACLLGQGVKGEVFPVTPHKSIPRSSLSGTLRSHLGLQVPGSVGKGGWCSFVRYSLEMTSSYVRGGSD